MTHQNDGAGQKRPLPTKATLDRLFDQWSREGMAFPRERSVVDMFRDHAQSRPDALAVRHGNQTLTFRTLDRLSNRVANRLLRGGLAPEEIVALPLDRSCLYVIAALGVLKAGGAYLPIDTSVPNERLAFLLSDSKARFAITTSPQIKRFRKWNGLALALEDHCEILPEESDAPVVIPSDPKRRAYVIYTSGSTGQPKGVEVEHHSLTNLVWVYQRYLDFTPDDRATLIANVSFDASVADLWPCLCAGGAVLIPPKSLITDLDGLIQWLATEGATFAFLSTALAQLMLTRPWPKTMALRFVETGGDTLHIRPPQGLPFRLLNAYGPTENTVVTSWTVITPEGDTQRPSIGRPFGNVKIYVLDNQGQPVPSGEEGELFIGGEQVARGYLNRPELTQARFLPDPFAGNPGAKMYRTGDWVRWRPDGEIDFIGRRDDQVQIRGRRVELGEIEQEIHRHPAVREVCCRPAVEQDAVVGIIAHVASGHSPARLQTDLREFLAKRLPAYMVPRDFVFYDQLPVTSRGKIDRAALRSPPPPAESAVEASLAVDTQEHAVAQLWYKLLPAARTADFDANFELLGGDSLHAVKLLYDIEALTGRRIALSTFLLEPTLPGLCRMVRESRQGNDPKVITLRSGGTRPPLFCLYGVGGDVSHYFELAKVLEADRPIYAIRSPALNNPDDLPRSIEEAARNIARLIREVYPNGTPPLLGYSWGGLLAFEIGRCWAQEGGIRPFVGLVGSPAPLWRVSKVHRLRHFARRFPNWAWEYALDYLKGRRRPPGLRNIARRLKQYVIKDPAEEQQPMPEWASTPLTRHHIELSYKYHPVTNVPFMVDVFRERETYEKLERPYRPELHPIIYPDTSHETDGGWGRWTGTDPRVHWLNTNHADVIKPAGVQELATRLRMALDEFDTAASQPARRSTVQLAASRTLLSCVNTWLLLEQDLKVLLSC